VHIQNDDCDDDDDNAELVYNLSTKASTRVSPNRAKDISSSIYPDAMQSY
jgi:hypothetical protein